MRRPIIAGNWKLNCGLKESAALARAVIERCGGADGVDVVLCPVYTSLAAVADCVKSSAIKLGAQNCHFAESGAFTGEIAPGMLQELGCDFCIIGHSERRQYFAETDANINKKALALYKAGITPIICVGETLDERKAGRMLDVVLGQLRGCLKDLPADKMRETVIAYEPVWAIGTGETATPAQAQEAHLAIRTELASLFGESLADAVRIQYGGSVKADNVKELMAQFDIDGALVGGASLKADSFGAIVNFRD